MYPTLPPFTSQQPYQTQQGNPAPPQQQYTFNNIPPQQFLQPQQNARFDRNMYSSTIQTSTSSSTTSTKPSFGFGKLQSMGRFIDDSHGGNKIQEAPTVMNSQPNNGLNFRTEKPEGKMFASMIFNKPNNEEMNRFPAFGVENRNEPTPGLSKLEALMARTKQQPPQPAQEESNETPEEKRKKEILSIKQELDLLNKKMENTVFKKTEGQGNDGKVYFQLPTRKSAVNPPQVDANKNFFNTYSSGQEVKTQATNAMSNTQVDNKGFFQNYSHQHQPSNNTTPSIPIAKPSPIQTQPVHSPSIGLSSTTNQFLSPKGEGEGGMFKKKNPYLLDESSKTNDYTPKTFLLSPKGVPPPTLNTFKAVEKQPAPIFEAKAAEVIEPPRPKKGMKRTDSVQNIKAKPSGPREFKKSDFAIGKKLGKGQYGQVMLVQHKETGFLCGLKVMSKKQIKQQKYENQIARELSINFFLSHRNIAPLYGYFSDEQNVYLLVEYCTGGQLLSMLRKSHRMEDPEVSPIIREICEGLDYIHKEQIIHRDIKPENILFNFNTVKICDFGWAVYSGNGMRKTVSGSPLYYSPEVVLETQYDEKIDIWAIGMMTYECLLGKIPFRIYSELDLNRIVEDEIKFPEYVDVTDDAKDLILKIMKKKPEERIEIKEIMRHPFITKYLKDRKVAPEVLEEFRKVLNG